METIKITLLITLLGSVSSGIGGILASIFKVKSKNKISAMYEITAGIMTGIVCIDMLPESFEIAPIIYSILGVAVGLILVYIIEKTNNNKNVSTMSLFVVISMAIHNAIEGLAIGTGFSHSFSLGLSILISMFLHDIPEGRLTSRQCLKRI